MSQHMCITTALTTQIAMQLQQSLSSRNQVPPFTINMVPQPASYIQGQSHIYHQHPMYNHATQPAMQSGLFNQFHVPQATNFAFHPSQGFANLNPALHNQSSQCQQIRNNNQTRTSQHINTNVNTSSNILEKQQENTPHVLYTDNSTNVIAQDPTITCSDEQNKMVRKHNEKTQHVPIRQPTTEMKQSELTSVITENVQMSTSTVQSEVAPVLSETIKESTQIVHLEENSNKQMTRNNQDTNGEGRQNQSTSF
ncbi:unnamed protein product [Mytilus coruscus]|uniref:Uncharacterized protein n=1 Tax=Mytilus coruscus TaxID=42192 RepID=A0A6J8AK07_MYTCO|nr:unnamed protein product [Mytilus coruscus]